MSRGKATKDLILLVADENMRFTLNAILGRCPSLSIRSISYDSFTHPQHDSGCLHQSHELLRSRAGQYAHALVLFDREGCGKETICTREQLESEVEARLGQSGWSDRAAAVVLDPELEIWVWSDSPHVDTVLGWSGRQPDLKSWLAQSGFLEKDQVKPSRPKEAVEAALRLRKKPRSSAIYAELASRVSFDRCIDPSFAKLREVLRGWFG
jgi:hypothetical protein